ncbi:MAG: hypothetical protein NTV49_10885 [Kiritimatiellaeota bacterium]|nr:hypothetical protein [Kiritimatiellota bacterium]
MSENTKLSISERTGVTRNTRRQGIALVTVLGMLCLLVVLAVAFAIAMRTERIAGRSYLDSVKARHLAHAALTRALDAMDAAMPNNMLYADAPIYSTNTPSANLYSGSATNYIPLGASYSAGTNAGWVVISSLTTTSQVAYLAVNCSGLLDANVAGGGTRNTGMSAAELVLTNALLTDYSASLTNNRASAKRFESVAELRQTWALGANSSNFVAFSRFPPFKQNFTNALIMLDVPTNTLIANQANIVVALQQCGLNTGTQAADAFSNLLAYADTSTDVPPGGTTNFYTKSVPMLTEVIASNVVSGVTNNWTNLTSVIYETWYPFPIAPAGSYQVTLANPPAITLTALSAPWTAPVLVSNAPAAFTPAAYSFNTSVFTYQQTSAATNNLAASGPGGRQINATVTLPAAFVDNASGQHVDHMPAGPPPFFSAYKITPLTSAPRGLGVIDPRINWRPEDWQAESASLGQITLGAMNVSVASTEGTNMFARTTGTIANAAELGFLLYDATLPWRTISLYDDGVNPLHPVLDYFGTSTQTNSVQRGLVNINSQNTNALATAFVNAPIQNYPGGPSNTVSAADAQMIATRLFTQTGANGTNSLAVVGRAVTNASVFASLADDGARESLVANSYRLLSPRQQLFTILLAAQVVGSGGVLAEQRAVAVVWRDPYPDTNGRHPAFVRFFKWLTE